MSVTDDRAVPETARRKRQMGLEPLPENMTIEQVARYALNGWAVYAKRKIEINEIGRLHAKLTELVRLRDTPPRAPEPQEART